MKIIRGEKEYELTRTEMRQIYKEFDREYLKEDVKTMAAEMNVDISQSINNIVADAETILEHNDSYWEAYWLSIEYAIAQYEAEE